jgi:hypothetical protein
MVLSVTAEAVGILKAAELQPGRDIGWACLAVADSNNSIAGLVADHERAGALAVEQVVSLSRINQRGPSSSAMTTYVPAMWRDGSSLPNRAVAAARA